MSLKNNFSTYLKDIEYPIKKEGWDISGILKKASNQKLKFYVAEINSDNRLFCTSSQKFTFFTFIRLGDT